MTDSNAVRKTELPVPKLVPDTFKQLRDLIYEKTGIHFQDNKTYLLESRLLAATEGLSVSDLRKLSEFSALRCLP